MRTFKSFLALLITSLVVSMIPAQAVTIPTVFEFSGSGYGHGVGMSQIGARSRALSGESATAILNYYYKDVVVAPYVDTHTIRVNIATRVKSISFTTHTFNARLEVFESETSQSTQVPPIATFAISRVRIFSESADAS